MYIDDPRDFTMAYCTGSGEVVPYFVKEYEKQWIEGNAMDKAILSIYYWEKQVQHSLDENQEIKRNKKKQETTFCTTKNTENNNN